ncbi:hypothetical protein AOQ71_09285 [Bradyrhizobium manausense]|uniref:Uncharacterized protein n=1 Tax=Bradyrhizobium manausense TaxID=989370 RepID=A0A0R3DZQ4_9BRAD|nr:hypothetical protein AOQ71_09285 [Bradyrhizobium manausense]
MTFERLIQSFKVDFSWACKLTQLGEFEFCLFLAGVCFGKLFGSFQFVLAKSFLCESCLPFVRNE